MRPRRILVLVAAFLSVGLLSSCGGVQPGVAARVGDETIPVSEVNRLTRGFCDAARRDFRSQGNVYPMNVLASVILQGLTMNAVIDRLAEEYDVEPSQAFAQQLADREQSFAALEEDQAEAAILVQSSQLYREDILTTIGRQQLEADGIDNPSVDDSLARGNDILARWLAENKPEIDPQYHLELDTGQPRPADSDTSYAVSSVAVNGKLADTFAVRQLDETEQQKFNDHVRQLPAHQRCG